MFFLRRDPTFASLVCTKRWTHGARPDTRGESKSVHERRAIIDPRVLRIAGLLADTQRCV